MMEHPFNQLVAVAWLIITVMLGFLAVANVLAGFLTRDFSMGFSGLLLAALTIASGHFYKKWRGSF